MTLTQMTKHGCEKFYWEYCYSIIGTAQEERPVLNSFLIGQMRERGGEERDEEDEGREKEGARARESHSCVHVFFRPCQFGVEGLG